MQDYQQRLILFALLLGITCESVKINHFNAICTIPLAESQSTAYSHSIDLCVEVIECPESKCSCVITDNAKIDGPWNVHFPSNSALATVKISNLEPNTDYSYTLTCNGAEKSVTVDIKTDHDRPSPPEDVDITLVGKSLNVTWKHPSEDATPISYYRITVDKELLPERIPKEATSYVMKSEYTSGNKHSFYVQTCYVNNQKDSVCSKGDVKEVQFTVPTTIPTPSTPTSTPSAAHSSSVSIPVLSLFLVIKLFW